MMSADPKDTQPGADSFHTALAAELDALRDHDLWRELRRVDSAQSTRLLVEGRPCLNFSSNDYLGLADHPLVKEAAVIAVRRYGAGSGASRLISGSLAPHHDLEQTLAAYKGAPAALTFSSGYTAALGAIGALVGRNDVVVLDRLVHACIIDAARLSGAKLRVFAHNEVEDLERILKWARGRPPGATHASTSRRPRILVVTESLFSMDGDRAPLAALVQVKDRHGAWLMVDEAHATGLYGPAGCGLVGAQDLGERVEVQMGTLGKALGSAGGFICGSAKLIELLLNRARTFVFSTAPVPAAAGAAVAAIQLAQSQEGEERRERLRQNVMRLRSAIGAPAKEARDCPQLPPSAIVPLMVGSESRALALSATLRDAGFFIPAIRYPTVARGQARLRITLTAAHEASEIEALAEALHRHTP